MSRIDGKLEDAETESFTEVKEPFQPNGKTIAELSLGVNNLLLQL